MSWRPPPDEKVAYGLFEHPTPREDGEPEVVRLRCDNDYRAEYEFKGFRFLGPAPDEEEPAPPPDSFQGEGYDPIDEADADTSVVR